MWKREQWIEHRWPKRNSRSPLGWFGMELLPLLLFVFSHLLLPLSEATCNSCLVRRSSLSWSTQWYFSESGWVKIKSNWNAKSFEPIYKNFTSGKALTWLRIKKMDPASLSHSPGWTFPLRVVGKRMIFMKNKIGEYLLVGKLHRQPWCARWTNPEVKFNIWKHVGIIRILPLVNSLLKGTTTLPSSGLTIPSFLPCQWELVWFVYK